MYEKMKSRYWNGTHIEKKKNTIDFWLREYYVLLCCFSVMICIFMFLITGIYIKSYNTMLDSVYCLEELYNELSKIQDITIESAFLENTDIQERSMSYKVIEEDMKLLQKLKISGNYQRNMRDLERLLAYYQEIYKTILTYSVKNPEQTAEMIANHMEQYDLLENIYEAIFNKKEIVYDELHQYFSDQRTELKKKSIWLISWILISLIFGFLLVRQKTRRLAAEIAVPIKELTMKAEQVKKNKLEDILQEEREYLVEELNVLSYAFRTMLCQIQEQITKLKENMTVREQLKEKEMENLRVINLLTSSELRCLQMQMNPHFLFNTLNMIQQTVYLDRKEKTSFLLKETASFLRYSLDYIGKNVPLQRELEALGNYISLQEERLGERIFFEFDLDESMNKMKVPCLILQPLVENSIIHGVADKMEEAQIVIRTQYREEENCGYIFIEDNGQGITEERLEELRENMNKIDTISEKGIGLCNVYKRLELFTEGKTAMKIDSQTGKGTVITIKLYGQMRDYNDKSVNSR